MNGTEWVTLIGVAASVVVNLGVIGRWLKAHKAAIIAAIPGVVDGAKTVEKAVETVGEDFTKFPGVGVVKAALGTELHHDESELRDSRILQVSGVALHTFLSDLSALNDTQLGSIKIFIETELKKLGITVTPQEVLNALASVQRSADMLKKSAVYTDTMRLVNSATAMKQAAEPTDESAKTVG